jgi:hypothetical protein
MAATSELIHPRTRNAFRDHCSDCGTVRSVERVFVDEGLDAAPWSEEWDRNGQRRGTFDRCTAAISWSDPADVRKVLNVFEQILTWGDGDWGEKARETLIRHLRRDGYEVDADGRLQPHAGTALAAIPLETVRDPSAIREHFDRISEAMDRDPALAISGAKALIEATTKTVLEELGVAYDPKEDVPGLVKAAQKVLLLDRDSVAPTAAGAESIKRILSNLSQVAVGVAELRNEYGADHGRARAVVGLGPRHARLAVGCASTYCRMLLETLEARRS